MRKRIVWLLMTIMLFLGMAAGRQEIMVYAEGETSADKMVPFISYPIDISGDASTDYYTYSTMWAAAPEVVSFFDYQNRYNVAYIDGEILRIQRYSAQLILEDQIAIPKSYGYFGNVTCDATGNYYVVWAQDDTDMKNCITMSVMKYDYQGTFLAECAYTGFETWDNSFGTQRPFYCANCNLTVNNGVLAVNYGRNMYNGLQSNSILYVDSASMKKLSGAGAYTSQSLDQRIIGLSDGGYLVLNHGDAYPRGFKISRLDEDRNHVGSLTNFHFREGGNRNNGYYETYAQLGGIVETKNAYVFCGSSERTLSVETAPTDGAFAGHSEARDLFIQILKKDFYNYFGPDTYRLNGAIRVAMGIKPDTALTDLYLSGSEVDYGILWLTDYDDAYYVANPKIISISDRRFVVMWEKRTYAEDQNVEAYYAVLDENGNMVVQPIRMADVRLAGNIDPVFRDGKIYWTTSDTNGAFIHSLNPFEQVKDYTISYELDGGENHYGNPYLYNITTETIKLCNPSKTGYVFDGWYEDSEFTKEITEIPQGSMGHKILYAKWKQNLDLSGLFAEHDNCYFVRNAEDIRAYSTIDEKPVINEFKCDGTYTYYFQADGTAMRNRLTYHPDGVHVIYFDEFGHEVFSDFANVKKTIAGDIVDDYCFFDVSGYLYVDVVTYDKEGKNLYYANPFGVMDRGKWFEFSDSVKWADGTPFDKSGGRYGYANDDGTLLTNTWIYDWEGRWCYLQGNGVAKY